MLRLSSCLIAALNVLGCAQYIETISLTTILSKEESNEFTTGDFISDDLETIFA